MFAMRVRVSITILLVLVLIFSVYKLVEIENNYSAENNTHNYVLQYKPSKPNDTDKKASIDSENILINLPEQSNEASDVNSEITNLRQLNGDIIGWITLDGTNIDYPFAQAQNNDFYLRNDINKKYAYAGTIFMDYRCNKNFLDYNSIIYGHHMKNGSMFHDLIKYGDSAFFENNKSGIIFLEDSSIQLEIFAYMLIKAVDLKNYVEDINTHESYIQFLKENSINWRDVNFSPDDSLVTLSTCSYEFENARAVLIAKANKQ